MTDREAIEALEMDCDLITFDPMTGNVLDLETVKLRNDLNYKCYLANKVAISALQEREERSKPLTWRKYSYEEWICPHCGYSKYCDTLDGGVLPPFCEQCGRPLKGAQDERL